MQTFTTHERQRAIAWKATTTALPIDAKRPGPYRLKVDGSASDVYPFCLPTDFASLNLLGEVRPVALELFKDLGIPWHSGIGQGPSTHLLSSQVQCVNALGQMVNDPGRIPRAFGAALGTTEVHQIEPGRWLTFEYIGDEDLLNEAVNGERQRGANCTSVDAAFLHTTADGAGELILIEWKYTERYRERKPERKDGVRRRRYEHLLLADNGPLDMSLVPFEELLQEPFYQLMRQQLLAHELEKRRAHGVDRVRVVHVLPADNLQYRSSLYGPALRKLGSDVGTAWQQLLRRPDRFVSLDHSIFSNPTVTSAEYVSRYHDTTQFSI